MITEYKKKKFELNKFLLILFLIILVWFFGSALFNNNESGEMELFVIQPGESVSSIANRLQEKDLIDSEFGFKAYLQLTDKGSELKAGEHYLSTKMSVKEIVETLMIASSQPDTQITIIEGWSNLDIAEYLNVNLGIKVNDFIAATTRDYSDYTFLPSRNIEDYLQGYLFPDTYRILPDASSEDIVGKMLDTFETKVYVPNLSIIQKSSMDLHDILTLASIVEMEVSSEADRKLVADIFLRRLADNYPLQSDATVNYVTKSGRAQSTINDTKIDSPYNTYKYSGLPPGPIGNPSISSIKAVLNPVTNTYYFFLTTKDDGRVIYSRTYDEHLQNKAKYLD
ncbi:MAG: endolytic transglycosylase MltG [Candidatus Komeilibacteria bacterium]